MTKDLRNNINLVNDLIDAIEALQKAEMGVTLRQEKDGRFDVGLSFGQTKIRVSAVYPKPEKSPQLEMKQPELTTEASE